MVFGAFFLRVDDASLFLVVALVILAGGMIAFIEDRRARRKPKTEQEHPRRAA
jgi:hypothetical protein